MFSRPRVKGLEHLDSDVPLYILLNRNAYCEQPFDFNLSFFHGYFLKDQTFLGRLITLSKMIQYKITVTSVFPVF